MNVETAGIGIARLGQIQVRAHDVERAANNFISQISRLIKVVWVQSSPLPRGEVKGQNPGP